METPAEVKEWAQNTVMGVLFGLILGGGRQWLEDRKYGEATLWQPAACCAAAGHPILWGLCMPLTGRCHIRFGTMIAAKCRCSQPSARLSGMREHDECVC